MRTTPAVALLLALSGCDQHTRCEEVSTKTVLDAEFGAGTSAGAMLQRAGGEKVLILTMDRGTGGLKPAGELVQKIVRSEGSARLVTYRLIEGTEDIALDCSPELRVPVLLTLDTGDGSLDESIDVELVGSRGEIHWDHSRKPPTLRGSYDPEAIVGPRGFTLEALVFSGSETEDGTSGGLHGTAIRGDAVTLIPLVLWERP